MAPRSAALLLLSTASILLVSCAPDRETKRRGLPIRIEEFALAQTVWDMDVPDSAPGDACGVGGTGLDWNPWLEARGQRARLASLVASNPPERLVGLVQGLQRERLVAVLSALLDHPALEVRRAAVQALKSLRERRGVLGLLAAAKHNAFTIVDETQRQSQESYRRELGAALMHITKVRPYEGPPQRKDGPPKIWTFDVGRLDMWLENEVLRARRWSE
ncbi:MAG: hypothetical protein ABIJ09_27450 [Pseudomonadota bacterium]